MPRIRWWCEKTQHPAMQKVKNLMKTAEKPSLTVYFHYSFKL